MDRNGSSLKRLKKPRENYIDYLDIYKKKNHINLKPEFSYFLLSSLKGN